MEVQIGITVRKGVYKDNEYGLIQCEQLNAYDLEGDENRQLYS
jgi:hypothetical protein